jgi:hypothetical protein
MAGRGPQEKFPNRPGESACRVLRPSMPGSRVLLAHRAVCRDAAPLLQSRDKLT